VETIRIGAPPRVGVVACEEEDEEGGALPTVGWEERTGELAPVSLATEELLRAVREGETTGAGSGSGELFIGGMTGLKSYEDCGGVEGSGSGMEPGRGEPLSVLPGLRPHNSSRRGRRNSSGRTETSRKRMTTAQAKSRPRRARRRRGGCPCFRTQGGASRLRQQRRQLKSARKREIGSRPARGQEGLVKSGRSGR
jgi:hypothetical protein